MKNPGKATLLKAFLTWALSPEGDAIAEELGYVPLSNDLESTALAKIEQIGW